MKPNLSGKFKFMFKILCKFMLTVNSENFSFSRIYIQNVLIVANKALQRLAKLHNLSATLNLSQRRQLSFLNLNCLHVAA